MKKIFILFCSTFLCGYYTLHSQNSNQKIEFQKQESGREILDLSLRQFEVHQGRIDNVMKKFRKYSLCSLTDIMPIGSNEALSLSLNISLPVLGEITLDLERTFIAQTEAKSYIAASNGVNTSNLKISPTYSGYIKDLPNSKVYLTLSSDYFAGIIQFSENEQYVIEPLINDYGVIEKQTLILYKTSDIIKRESYKCLVDDVKNTSNLASSSFEFTGCYEVDIAQAADYSMWQKYGGYQGVVDRMATIINLCQADYENQFNSKIYLRIAGTWLSSCPTCDPWPNTNDQSILIENFASWSFKDNFFVNINHDASQLWVTRDLNGFAGWAYIKEICTYYSKQIIVDYTNDVNCMRKVVSHELGHNFGAGHDPSGSNTIMTSGENCSNSWSQKSKNEINPYINELINNKCLFPCTPYHFEYAKIAEEGYRFRQPHQIKEQTKFYECEPIWRYWSIDQISPNIVVQGKSEVIFPNGQKDVYDINENSGPVI